MLVSVSTNVRDLQQSLDGLAKKQLPGSLAAGLTALARRVQTAETDALSTVFDRPTPFTQRAFGVLPANNRSLTAAVFTKDIQAAYLAPYEDGGVQVLGNKRSMLVPAAAAKNQYGNLPRTTIARLKARKDIFVGSIATSHGAVDGVWQRLDVTRSGRVRKHRAGRATHYDKQHGPLKLLVLFGAPQPVRQRFGFHERALGIIAAHASRDLGTALAAALAAAETGR